MDQSHKVGTSILYDQPQGFSSPELVTRQGRDIIGGIQPMFVYQYASPDYYEPVEHWEVDENTNVDVFEKIEKNYPLSSKYAEAQVNVLD